MSVKQMNKQFWQDFDKKLSKTLVPCFSNETVRPCTKEDFEDYRKTLADKLLCIDSLLNIIVQNEDEWITKTKKNLIKVIIIIGEQHSKSAWNTDETIEVSKLLIPKICKIFKSENISEILKDDDIFLSIVMFLRPKLLKDTWKSFPAAVICYKWILESVEKPLLKRHVPEVLPTALIIFDDYVQENQILGLQCINIIIDHCHNSRSLKNLNYDEVIFQALEKMAHKVEPNMIISLYSCISKLLENIQYCKCNSNLFGWTKQDDILLLLLDNMELQPHLVARYAYVISLNSLLTHSGSGKWSERIGRILSDYCENETDIKTTDASLDLLKTYLSIYQPKGPNFYIAMYSSLLKLKHKLISSENYTKEIIRKTDQCISLLNELCPKLSKEIIENNIIQSVIDTT